MDEKALKAAEKRVGKRVILRYHTGHAREVQLEAVSAPFGVWITDLKADSKPEGIAADDIESIK